MDKEIITDFHIHSVLSGDAYGTLEENIKSAIAKGCKYIALTEHCNLDHLKHGQDVPTADLKLYDKEFKRLKKKYESQINMTYGIEMGYDKQVSADYGEIIAKYDYDYIINSIHIIEGNDCYWEKYFDTRTQREGFENYLKAVYESLSAPYRYNSVGHFGYITRNCPFQNRDMLSGYEEHVEAILKKMIEKGVVLEANTSVNGAPGPCLPQKEILTLYKALGGELIIYGSDAHSPPSICRAREQTMRLLKECGFRYHVVFIGKEIKQLLI